MPSRSQINLLLLGFSIVICPSSNGKNLIYSPILGVIEVEMSTHEGIPASSSEVLPWLSCVERQSELSDVTPGEYVLRTLFSEFTILTERKLEHVLAEPLVSCFDF